RQSIAHSKAPSVRALLQLGRIGSAAPRACARIYRSFVLFVRGTRRVSDIGPRARTGINQLLYLEVPERRLVVSEPLALDGRLVVPVQSEPAKIVTSLAGRSWFDARRIDVFHAQQDLAAARPRRQPGDQIRPGVADMLRARG